MKKIIFTIILLISFILIILIAVLSTTGIETGKFNNLISKKINQNNDNINLLKEILIHLILNSDQIIYKYIPQYIGTFRYNNKLGIAMQWSGKQNFGNFLKVLINVFIISPLPAPNSIKLNLFGHFKFSQKEIIQIAIISENNIDIFGDVIKSPFAPKGFFFI